MLNRTPGGGAELRQSPRPDPSGLPSWPAEGPPFSLVLSPNEGRAGQGLSSWEDARAPPPPPPPRGMGLL